MTLEYPLRPPELRLVKMQWPAEEGSKKGGAVASLPKSELATFEAEVPMQPQRGAFLPPNSFQNSYEYHLVSLLEILCKERARRVAAHDSLS